MAIKLTPFVEYLLEDAFRELDDVQVKRMFGGYGFYLDGRIFAFTGPNDELLFKATDETSRKYKDKGSKQFVYEGHTSKGPVAMPYWELPQDIMDDPVELAAWAHESASLSKRK